MLVLVPHHGWSSGNAISFAHSAVVSRRMPAPSHAASDARSGPPCCPSPRVPFTSHVVTVGDGRSSSSGREPARVGFTSPYARIHPSMVYTMRRKVLSELVPRAHSGIGTGDTSRRVMPSGCMASSGCPLAIA